MIRIVYIPATMITFVLLVIIGQVPGTRRFLMPVIEGMLETLYRIWR